MTCPSFSGVLVAISLKGKDEEGVNNYLCRATGCIDIKRRET
jgi:hypothetical protein